MIEYFIERESENLSVIQKLVMFLRIFAAVHHLVIEIQYLYSINRLEIDVLILGCEASLWIGEQFAGDLQNLFPALRVVAISANKVLGIPFSYL